MAGIALKQLMLVTRNVQFAIDLKRALEALGDYSVTTVADVRNAIEQFREHPQQLVLLDTSGLTIAPAIMIEMLRARQDEVSIVLAPDQPEAHRLASAYSLQGVVDIPVMARTLLPVLEAALLRNAVELPTAEETQPETDGALTGSGGQDTVAIEALVDDLLQEPGPLNYTRRRLQASLDLLHPPAEDAAALAPLELLLEADDEGDTVRYRFVHDDDQEAFEATTIQVADEAAATTVARGAESETVRGLAHALAEGRSGEAERKLPVAAATGADGAGDLADSGVFQQLLNRMLDESTALDNLTLDSMFDTTRELPGALGTGAVPAWIRATEKFIREPEFLGDFLPSLQVQEGPGETTRPRPADGSAEMADTMEPRSKDIEFGADESLFDPPEVSEASSQLLSSRRDEPYLAQLALTMTQIASDVAVEATVLSRENRIVAFSGPMELAAFRELRGVIGDDWGAVGNRARIRFVPLPESGADYMLHSRTTLADMTLTLVFAGGKQLSEIRRGADQMLDALAATMDDGAQPAAEAEQPAPAEASAAKQPFAFVWMVADSALLLRKRVAEQLVFWLEVQLNSLGWIIHRLDVHQDFIYLRADAPVRASPEALVRTVMERAQQIACSEDEALPQDLWADAYLVLQPGREMSERELERFLQFVRVESATAN